jgi:hypothetical protein
VGKYNVVFTVDSDVKMNVTVHFMCTEEVWVVELGWGSALI